MSRQSLEKAIEMAAFVSENYTCDLHTRDISDVVGLNFDYASSIFKRVFGISLNNFMLEHRITHARRSLIRTNNKIADIALDAGFNSISPFNDGFRKLCGCTPREYRNQHRPH